MGTIPEPSAEAIQAGADLVRDRWAARHAVANPGQKALLLVIASHCDNATLSGFISNERLRAESAISSPTTLAKHLAGLAERRSIASIPLLRSKGRGQSVNLFILNPGGWLGDAATVAAVQALVEARYSAIKGAKVPFTGAEWSKLGHEKCPGIRLPGMYKTKP
jgi:hypothetical protein